MAAEHRFLKFILPAKAFATVKNGTKQWLIECRCGHKMDLWDCGGVRYKATGEPWQSGKCSSCGKTTMLKIRRKTKTEKQYIP
jgi:hypothetical protein